MIRKITKRGPKAFDIFVDILKNNNFGAALLKLYESDQSISNNRNNPIVNNNANYNIPRYSTPRRPSMSSSIIRPSPRPFMEHNGNDCLPVVPDIFSYTKYNEQLMDLDNEIAEPIKEQYLMNKRKKGVLFLVNITQFERNEELERRGAQFDTENLKNLFAMLDFEIFKYEDITKNQFQATLNKLLDSDYCKQTQCFIMILMSHGEMLESQKTYVKFYDNHCEEVKNIMENFSNKNCPTLVKKPKILFFPFCR